MKIAFKDYRILWFLIAAMPLIWPFGGEQFGLPIVVLLLMMRRVFFKKRSLLKSTSFTLWLFWLLAIIVSFAMVDEQRRYVTWVRNFSVACSGISMAYLVYETHNQIRLIRGFLFVLLFYATACTLSGLLAVVGFHFSYMSPVGNLLHVGNTGYLKDIFMRSFVQADADWFETGFIRPKGILLYSNLLSGMILVGSGIKVYLLATRKNSRWVIALLSMLLLLDGVVVVATLSRSAWLGLGAAFVTVLLLARLRASARFSLVGAFLVANIITYAAGVDDLVLKRFEEKAISNAERGKNYVMIWEAVSHDPGRFIFGYGTQREVWYMNVPLGSHSTPLGMLFKYGLVGVGIFSAGLSLVFLRLWRALRLDRTNRYLGALLMSSLVQLAVQALFIEIDVDVVYMMVWWVLVGLAMAYSSLVLRRHQMEVKQRQQLLAVQRYRFA